jgi:hypothetical protein
MDFSIGDSAMTFDEAKANFLRDFPNAGEGIPERITEAQGIIGSPIVLSRLQSGFGGLITEHLRNALDQITRAERCARACDFTAEVDRLKTYHNRVKDLISEIDDVKTRGRLLAEEIEGGKRSKSFITDKLQYDSALVAIDIVVDVLSSLNLLPPTGKLYCRAGLMYYCGYDNYEGYLRPGSLFPPPNEFKYLPIAKNQDQRLRVAKSYLNAELFGKGSAVALEKFGQVKFQQAVADEIEKRLFET